jgi:hypothetical protein
VRIAQLGSTRSVQGARVRLFPLEAGGPKLERTIESREASVIVDLGPLVPGAYVLDVRRVGLHPQLDTLTARAGVTDTVDVRLEAYGAEDRNPYNCRPRHFRRAGESACVTEHEGLDSRLDFARSVADQVARRRFHLSDRSRVATRTVRDERLCERAARAYGGVRTPPRRMIVIDAGDYFVVSDPFEPEPAGEWNQWQVYDRRWRLLDLILGS